MFILISKIAGVTSGIVSAYRYWFSENENLSEHHKLTKDIIDMGYQPKIIYGFWKGPELSCLVPGIQKSQLIKLGQKYEQEAVAWIDENGFLENLSLVDPI
jgi:hypothetical protein